MQRRLIWAVFTVLAVSLGRSVSADVTVVHMQTNTLFQNNGKSQVDRLGETTSILYIKAGRQRSDHFLPGATTPGNTGIFDAIKGRRILINWARKEYFTDTQNYRPAFDPKEQTDTATSSSVVASGAKCTLTRTNSYKIILGHRSRLYTETIVGALRTVQSEIWGATDLPEDIQEVSSHPADYHGPYIRGTVLDLIVRFPHVLVDIKAVSISNKPIPNSMFDIPKGFKQVLNIRELP